MFKLFASLLLLVISITNWAQSLRAKDIIFQPYFALNYGIPLNSSKSEPGDVNETTNTRNAIGFMAQYFIADRISLGIDLNSRTESRSFNRSKLVYDPILAVDYLLKQKFIQKTSLFRVYTRMDYHLVSKNTKFDFYSGFCIGLKFQKNQRFIDGIEQNFEIAGASKLGAGNFALRFCLGGRYFFNRHFGLAGEIGLGGPLANVGLVFKI